MFIYLCLIFFVVSISCVFYKYGIDNCWVYFVECVISILNRKLMRRKVDEINIEVGFL